MQSPLIRLMALTLTAATTITACGSDGGSGPSGPSYENLSGSYAGVMAGTTQGITLNAQFSITLNQSGSSLSGTYALSGTLTDGVDVVDVAGTGTLTGSLASGNNPSVNIVARPALCPNYTAQYSGSYDSANQLLTLSGPVEFLDGGCAVFLSYQMVILLYR